MCSTSTVHCCLRHCFFQDHPPGGARDWAGCGGPPDGAGTQRKRRPRWYSLSSPPHPPLNNCCSISCKNETTYCSLVGDISCQSWQYHECRPALEPSGSPGSQPPVTLPSPSLPHCAPCLGTSSLALIVPSWSLLWVPGRGHTVLFLCPLGPACSGGPLTAPSPLSLHLAAGHGDGRYRRLPDLRLVHALWFHGFAALGPGSGPPAPHGHCQRMDIQQLR